MNYTRRDLSLLLPLAAAATAQAQKSGAVLSKAFVYEDLPVKVNGANKQRAVLKGDTHSGYPIELHLTELGPGQAPHPPHKHVHEEMLMLQDGVLDVTINGQVTHLTAGSIAYVASNEEHGWRNPGPGRAQYFVIALGPNT
ncbi:MAG TPA: cupin domain-containing protein [Bryobacteraceae bacterium]|nr:cupin domain-containing protein [Bryobacteraceae bacterium]